MRRVPFCAQTGGPARSFSFCPQAAGRVRFAFIARCGQAAGRVRRALQVRKRRRPHRACTVGVSLRVGRPPSRGAAPFGPRLGFASPAALRRPTGARRSFAGAVVLPSRRNLIGHFALLVAPPVTAGTPSRARRTRPTAPTVRWRPAAKPWPFAGPLCLCCELRGNRLPTGRTHSLSRIATDRSGTRATWGTPNWECRP